MAAAGTGVMTIPMASAGVMKLTVNGMENGSYSPVLLRSVGLPGQTQTSITNSVGPSRGLLPAAAFVANGLGARKAKVGDCKGAEDECTKDEECGNDTQPAPRPPELICGEMVDKKVLLPAILFTSTFVGGMCVMLVNLPMVVVTLGLSESWRIRLTCAVSALYVISLGTMVYCVCSEPGLLSRKRSVTGDLPERAHKMWLYDQPVRRYDHYCRWLTNAIGLWNHREFLVFLVSLMLIAVLGTVLAVVAASRHSWVDLVIVGVHCMYSAGMVYCVWPIFRVHVTLVSRNELGKEYMQDKFYVVRDSRKGEDVPVEDLSSDEQDEDNYVYVFHRNRWDKGCISNCWLFWLHARWSKKATGEF